MPTPDYRLHGEDDHALYVRHPSGRVHLLPKASTPSHLLKAARALPPAEPIKMADAGQVPEPDTASPPQDPLLAPTLATAGGVPGGPVFASARDRAIEDAAQSADRQGLTAYAAQIRSGAVDVPDLPPPETQPGASAGAAPSAAAGGGPPQASADASAVAASSMPALPSLPGLPSGDVEKRIKGMEVFGFAGAEAQKHAQVQLSTDLQGLYGQSQKELATIQQQHQADRQAAISEWNNAREDYAKQKVDPNHFWSSRTDSQKLTSTIGLILGGIGSGLTRQPNAALGVIDRAIDRDIDAQKAEMGKKQNLVSMLYQKVGDVDTAAAMARMYLYADVDNRAKLAAARAGPGQAEAAEQLMRSHIEGQALGPLTQLMTAKYQAAWQRTQMEWQMGMMRYAQAHTTSQGYVPSSTPPPMLTEPSLKGVAEHQKSVGEMTVNLPGGLRTWAVPEVAKDTNKTFASLENLDQQTRRLAALASRSAVGIHAPGTGSRATYESYASSLTTELNKLQGLNRLNENEYKEFGNMIPTEREWLTGTGAAKAKSLLSLIDKKRQEEYSRLGLNVGAKPQETPIGAGAR